LKSVLSFKHQDIAAQNARHEAARPTPSRSA
jgi:hypothetical protein